MLRHRLRLPLIALACSALAFCAQDRDLPAPTPSAEQSVFFGSIKLLVNIQGHDRRGFYVQEIGSHGGLIGRSMKAVVKLTAENTASHEVSTMEFNERSKDTNPKFMLVLPRGTYRLSIESPVIRHMNGGPVIAEKEFTSLGGGTAVYLGDLSIWGIGLAVGRGPSKPKLWISCDQRKGATDDFAQRYPQFKGRVTQAPPIGGEEIFIPIVKEKPDTPK